MLNQALYYCQFCLRCRFLSCQQISFRKADTHCIRRRKRNSGRTRDIVQSKWNEESKNDEPMVIDHIRPSEDLLKHTNSRLGITVI